MMRMRIVMIIVRVTMMMMMMMAITVTIAIIVQKTHTHASINKSINQYSPASINGIGGKGVSSRVCTSTDGEDGPDTPSAFTE